MGLFTRNPTVPQRSANQAVIMHFCCERGCRHCPHVEDQAQ